VDLTDGQTIFAIAFTFVMLIVAFAVVAFALWYSGDQQEI
jgi:cbb3-type cytochrome oxidase subunit 3